MPIKEMPKFGSVPTKMLKIPQPAIGGLNLKDLEFEQDVTQSPDMLNMMYRNGSFSKRYGQEIYDYFDDEIYATIDFQDTLLIHSGTKIYKGTGESKIQLATGMAEQAGLFIHYNMGIYYICNEHFYQYVYDYDTSAYVWSEVAPLVPEVYSECKPDGSESNKGEDLNVLSEYFDIAFNGDGSATQYKVGKIVDAKNELIDWSGDITVTVGGTALVEDTSSGTSVEAGKFKRINADKLIKFGTAPTSGDDNVVIRMELLESVYEKQRGCILNAKYYATYGGIDNARLFLGGFGDRAKGYYMFSEAVDATHFPIYNFEVVGNSAEDITGFGLQYNTLFIFKPSEIYSLASYTQTYATTSDETEVGMETFKAQIVNATKGCDAPYTIQLIDNRLTWFNSKYGVCTLVSSNIIDERNVRPISRNIDRTNSFNIVGVLDKQSDKNKIVSVDYDNKYFLCFPDGKCFVWDYQISPYYYTSSKETEVKSLDWFLFDNFFVKRFVQTGKELFYIGLDKEVGDGLTDGSVNIKNLKKAIIKLNDSFNDLDFDKDGVVEGINSHYMTPFFQFEAVEYLKNVKEVFIQCRGDTSSIIDLYYYTNESITPEQDQDSIRIGGRIWNNFHWGDFQWLSVNWANTFRRKCSLKKVQMVSFYFDNENKYENGVIKTNVAGRDMSISHISMNYQIVKTVR